MEEGFSQRGLTFVWPLVLTVGTFYRKVILTSEAWAGWDFLQKCSWRPVWACSPPNLVTERENVTAIVKKKKKIRRAFRFSSEGVLRERFYRRIAALWEAFGTPRCLALFASGQKTPELLLLGCCCSKSQTEKQNITLGLSMKAPIPDQDIENKVKGH